MSRHSASYARTKREQLTLIQTSDACVNGRLIRWPHDLCYGHSGYPHKRDDVVMMKPAMIERVRQGQHAADVEGVPTRPHGTPLPWRAPGAGRNAPPHQGRLVMALVPLPNPGVKLPNSVTTWQRHE
jgi:hypothetical protein